MWTQSLRLLVSVKPHLSVKLLCETSNVSFTAHLLPTCYISMKAVSYAFLRLKEMAVWSHRGLKVGCA